MSGTAYTRPLEPEEVTFLDAWLRTPELKRLRDQVRWIERGSDAVVEPPPGQSVPFLEHLPGQPVIEWLEQAHERFNRGRSARREPNVSHAEFLSLFVTKLGSLAPNGSPGRDVWELLMQGLRERDRTRRAEERQERLQARQEGKTPASEVAAPTAPAEPERTPTKEDWERAYDRIYAHHLERVALRTAAPNETQEIQFFTDEVNGWKPEPPQWPRPRRSALHERMKGRWYNT